MMEWKVKEKAKVKDYYDMTRNNPQENTCDTRLAPNRLWLQMKAMWPGG